MGKTEDNPFRDVSYLYWKEGEEQKYIYSDYKNLFNLEAHRANKSKDELASLRYEIECKCGWDQGDHGWDPAEWLERFEPSILRRSEIWGAADEAVLNTVHKNLKTALALFILQKVHIKPAKYLKTDGAIWNTVVDVVNRAKYRRDM